MDFGTVGPVLAYLYRRGCVFLVCICCYTRSPHICICILPGTTNFKQQQSTHPYTFILNKYRVFVCTLRHANLAILHRTRCLPRTKKLSSPPCFLTRSQCSVPLLRSYLLSALHSCLSLLAPFLWAVAPMTVILVSQQSNV